jgi:hypothetical protein
LVLRYEITPMQASASNAAANPVPILVPTDPFMFSSLLLRRI